MRIHVKNITLCIDVDNDAERTVKEAVELVNLTLQREPYGLGACLELPDTLEIVKEDEDEQDALRRMDL